MADERPLVVCVGNALRGDDGVGPAVAQVLRERGMAAVVHDGEPASLIDAWDGAAAVVLVDAVVTGADAGTVHRFDAAAGTLRAGGGASTHGLGVAEAVELARALGRLPRRVVVIGVEGADFAPGAELSPPVTAAVAEAADAVARELS